MKTTQGKKSHFKVVGGAHSNLTPEVNAPAKTDMNEASTQLVSLIKAAAKSDDDPSGAGQKARHISYLLRTAFSFSTQDMTSIPLHLRHDHAAAKRYIKSQIRNWVKSQNMEQLFQDIGLQKNYAAAFRNYMPSLFDMDEAATWLCAEFGHLNTERQARHCRRYLATKLTSYVRGDLSQERHNTKLDADTLQAQLSDWTNPCIDIEKTLHFQKVIIPICNRIEAIPAL